MAPWSCGLSAAHKQGHTASCLKTCLLKVKSNKWFDNWWFDSSINKECVMLCVRVSSAGRWLTLWCSTLRWQSLGIGGRSMMERRACIRPTHCLWPPPGWADKQDTHVQSQKHSLAVQPGCKPCLCLFMSIWLHHVWSKYSGYRLLASHIAHAHTHAHTHSPNSFILSNSLLLLLLPCPPSTAGGPGCHPARWGRQRSPFQSVHKVCVVGQLAHAPRGSDWPQHAWPPGAGQTHQHQPGPRCGCCATTPALNEVSW